MISNVAQLYVGHNLSRVVRLTISANYAQNVTTPVEIFTFKSFSGSAILAYNLTRTLKLSLSQWYNYYEYSGVSPFDRYQTMLTLEAYWK